VSFFDREQLTEVEVPAVPLPERRRDEPPPRPKPPVEQPEQPEPPREQPESPREQPEPAAPAAPQIQDEQPQAEHTEGEFRVPDGYTVLQGEVRPERRAVAVIVSRFNGEITARMLDEALAELERTGVDRSSVTVMPVPGAFELPLAALALAKTRRYACVVALGCVIRGETAHFDYVAGEAASGLQLAAIETGVPVAFGVLTTETREQAEARIGRAADAVRSGLEMADVFGKLRTRAVTPAA
jgi:6,7-dimethyl-8-ribityllumazine synthase